MVGYGYTGRINGERTLGSILICGGSSAGSTLRMYNWYKKQGLSTQQIANNIIGTMNNPLYQQRTSYFLSNNKRNAIAGVYG